MIIEKLELTHFGKFHLKTIDFTPGLNVVYGRNEAGKSTIHAFVKSMLFGISDDDQGKETYERYLPWDSPDEFGGKMWISKEGHRYCITRCFIKNRKSLSVVDETTGESLEPALKALKKLFDGLTENNYINTICIEQLKSSSEPQLADELSSLMINAAQSKSVRINVEQARSILSTRRQKLKSTLIDDADDAQIKCEKAMAESKSRISRLQKQKYLREKQQKEINEKLSTQNKQADEDMLAYERERDELRRSYEAAQKAYENAPQVDESELESRNYSWVTMLILTFLFFGGAIYMYFVRGMSTRTEFIVTTALVCLTFLSLVGVFISLYFSKNKTARLKADYELSTKLRESLEKSTAAFEECKQREPQSLEERNKPLKTKQDQADREVNYLDKQLKEEQQLHSSLEEKSRSLKEAVKSNQKIQEEITTVEMALKTINKVASRNHDTFGNLLNNEASKLLSQITGAKYEKISIGKDMKVTIYTGDRNVPLEGVSRGTIEQVYLCVRVAAAKLLWQKDAMPFLFDDVFAYYDDERLEGAMRMLKNCGHQAIIFSCHQREDRLL